MNLDITAIAEKLEDVIPDSILFTAVPKPKIDQVRDYCNVNCPEKPKKPSFYGRYIINDHDSS